MASFYSILQFVPDEMSGERVNFGVIAFDSSTARVRVVGDWSRVSRFAGGDVSYLKRFAARLVARTSPDAETHGAAPLLPEDVRRMASHRSNSIQVTEPRAALQSVDELLAAVFGEVVRERTERPAGVHSRQEAKQALVGAVRASIQRVLGGEPLVDRLLRSRSIAGVAENQVFDCVAGNGAPAFVGHALSFQTNAEQLQRTVRDLAFRISDVRRLQATLPFGVYCIPPHAGLPEAPRLLEAYDIAQKVYGSLDVELLTAETFQTWADPLAERLVVEHHPAS